ncbi:DUF2164 domain-containing protein [Sediminibacillus halophilus]|uniref:Uncharacterized conserved protein, DUF2164 family n=1 Tax=Sediminibacillus halophilus TaxID=482461 RepID=A0A1G9VBZ1_9BACI|nr:DUF2164 domain-containing protein [Sediminibacillus halophilus]SDM69734.1 Uncharacterized conserved protein, DUF2164 family [Sediminibacillus halophilus]
MKQSFELTPQQKEDMTAAIKAYFSKERNEDLGDLAASLILDFFMEELAPKFYNIGVEDSHAFLSAKLEDIFEIQK